MSLAVEMALGARSQLRRAARLLIEVIDGMAEDEIEAAGYTSEDTAVLERIAAWHIEGVPYGDWRGGR
jgi:hypothetical protein